jgi:hypothetical protein
MGPNFQEYHQYRFHDQIEGNSRFQPNRRCHFCDQPIECGFVDFFCLFRRIYLDNLYGKNRYNNLKVKVLRYGEARDHYQLFSCLREHHQRLGHGEKCNRQLRFLTISRLDHRVQTIYALSL